MRLGRRLCGSGQRGLPVKRCLASESARLFRCSSEGAELMAGSGAVLEAIWRIDPRSEGICRPYSAIDVERLRGTVRVRYAFAHAGAERLWKLLDSQRFLQPIDTTTGEQAVERVAAG